jgi:TonB family protein
VRAKSVCSIFVASVLVFFIGSGNLQADSFGTHMQSGKDYMSKGEFDSAITEYQEALRSKKESIEARSWLGMAYERLGDRFFGSGDTDKAIEAYRNALASVPDDPYWHEQLGNALEKKGDQEGALKEYRAAAELAPLDEGLQVKAAKPPGGPPGLEHPNNRGDKARERPMRVGPGVSAPIPISKPDPAYSERARQAKFQGTVVMQITVDPEGNVSGARVVKPLGLGLDAKALETVRTWTFQPAMKDGVPVPVTVMVEFSFRLF